MLADEKTLARLRAIAEAARDRFRAEHYRCTCGCAQSHFKAAVSAWVDYGRAGGLCPLETEKLATDAMLAHAAEVESQANAIRERRGQTIH